MAEEKEKTEDNVIQSGGRVGEQHGHLAVFVEKHI